MLNESYDNFHGWVRATVNNVLTQKGLYGLCRSSRTTKNLASVEYYQSRLTYKSNDDKTGLCNDVNIIP